jgi:agmatine deiminase
VKANVKIKKALILTLLLIIAAVQVQPCLAEEARDFRSIYQENYDESLPLPRWRETGTPYNENQSLQPYVIVNPMDKDMPTSGIIAAPAEYTPSRGVLFSYFSNGWPTVVRDMVVALTNDPTQDDIAYVVVANSSQQSYATSAFTSGGADMSKVEFIIQPMDAVWIRDYGPHFIYQDSAIGIVNSQYYPTRALDNFVPALLGEDYFEIPTYDMGLYYSGGNFLPGRNRIAFVSSIMNLDNPSSAGFDSAFIAELCQTYQGIDTLHVMPQLPFSVDGTGHIDMWLYIVDSNTCIISEFIPGSNATAISVTNNAVPYMEALGYEVFRIPAWNASHPDNGYATHWTYTNATRINDRILISTYGTTYPAYQDEDSIALEVWEEAAGPGVEIIQINSFPIIWAAGAIHCITMQVPRHTGSIPAAHVVWPNGGELFVSGDTETIHWGANDTDNEPLSKVVLYYSTNDGGSYELIDTTENDGLYDWTVPVAWTTQARVKVVAVASDADEFEAVSENAFEISYAAQMVYDFSTGAGVDKFCRGYQTYNWTSNVDGDQTPVTSEISGTNYTKIAYSDATGNDYDPNRYRSPTPSGNFESTHIFEFTIGEIPADIDDIELYWEGYSDYCTMTEMYVWDYTEGNWSDGEGLFSQNRFTDSWAGNRDGYLEKHIRADFDRYIDGSGLLTVMIYAERAQYAAFHDYISVTVSVASEEFTCGDANGDDTIDELDLMYIYDYMFAGGVQPSPIASADVDQCGSLNMSDIVFMMEYYDNGGPAPCAGSVTCELPVGINEITLGCPVQGNATTGDSIAIPVYLTSDIELFGFTLGFEYDSDDIEITAVDFDGSVIPVTPTAQYETILMPSENKVLVAWTSFTTNLIPMPVQTDGLLFTIWVQVPKGIPEQTVDINSCTEFAAIPNTEFLLSPLGGGSIHPAYTDCGTADLDIIAPPYICGDADGSEEINVSDAVWIINYVFVGGDAPDPIESGDADCSGECNVSDAVWIINYVFVGGNEPCDTDGDTVPDC